MNSLISKYNIDMMCLTKISTTELHLNPKLISVTSNTRD